MNRILLSIGLVLALCIPTWAAYASPHRLTHKAPKTHEVIYEDTTTDVTNHQLIDNDKRIMPSAVQMICLASARVELVIPLMEYPWVGGIAYVETDEDHENAAYFTPDNSFGGFDYETMFFRFRDPADPTKPYTGEACDVYWYYDLPIQEEHPNSFRTYPGCTSPWSEVCA